MERKPPIVTVVIPTYNSSHTLKLTLSSVLNQTFQDFEIWVIGDACTDDTKEVIDSLQDDRIHWHNRKKNSGGQPAPNNEGVRRAKGEFIAHLGHDDLWMQDHLLNLYNYITEHDFDFVHSLVVDINQTGVRFVTGRGAYGVSPNERFARPSSWFYKKSIVNEVGIWPENFKMLDRAPDNYYYHMINNSNLKVECFPQVSVIKFSSDVWNSYSDKEAITNISKQYWDRLVNNPNQFQFELLNEVAYSLSYYNLEEMVLSPKQASLMMLKYYYKKARKHLGMLPGFNILFRALNNARKRRVKKRRGLV